MHAYKHRYICIYTYKLTCTQTNNQKTYKHTSKLTYIHTCIHTYIHTYMHTYMLTYMHTYIHPHIRAYTYTHTSTCFDFLHIWNMDVPFNRTHINQDKFALLINQVTRMMPSEASICHANGSWPSQWFPRKAKPPHT